MNLRSMNQFSMNFRSMDFRLMDFRSMDYHGAVCSVESSIESGYVYQQKCHFQLLTLRLELSWEFENFVHVH
jgi:hypothetical protein